MGGIIISTIIIVLVLSHLCCCLCCQNYINFVCLYVWDFADLTGSLVDPEAFSSQSRLEPASGMPE